MPYIIMEIRHVSTRNWLALGKHMDLDALKSPRTLLIHAYKISAIVLEHTYQSTLSLDVTHYCIGSITNIRLAFCMGEWVVYTI